MIPAGDGFPELTLLFGRIYPQLPEISSDKAKSLLDLAIQDFDSHDPFEEVPTRNLVWRELPWEFSFWHKLYSKDCAYAIAIRALKGLKAWTDSHPTFQPNGITLLEDVGRSGREGIAHLNFVKQKIGGE